MKYSDINTIKMYEGLYITLGAKEKITDEGLVAYYLNIDGIVNKDKQMIDIPLIVANPFQAISSYDKTVPFLSFTMDITDDTSRVPSVTTKYYNEEYDYSGELIAIEYKRIGDPINYNFTLTGEVRSEMEGIYLMNFLRDAIPVPSGRFFWKNDYDNKLYSFNYINSSCQRTRELFNIVTPNIVVTMSFEVIAYWDYKAERRIERDRVKELMLTIDKK